jgi:hypothetical protein
MYPVKEITSESDTDDWNWDEEESAVASSGKAVPAV